MNHTDIERLIALVERSRVTELDYTDGQTRVRIVRAAAQQSTPSPTSETAPSNHHILPAGMFGTFYRAPAPDQPPFVSEGDQIEEGQVLAILEAMKVFNRVEADRAGRVTRILVENGATVQAGTPLFAIAPP